MTLNIDNLRNPLLPGLQQLAVPGADALVDPLLAYLALLHKWNKAYNLTAVRDPAEMLTRHLLDAFTVLPYISGKRVIDVGTGAGLPGIPLALALPDADFVLLDTNGKKVRFLEHVVGELALGNVRPVQARVEQFAEGDFDTVVCRAFSSLADFVEQSGHLPAAGGRLVAMKGKRPDAELAALPVGWQIRDVHAVQVPGLDAERHIVLLGRDAT